MEKSSTQEKYTNEVLNVLLNRYKKLLILSREILTKTESAENLKKFDDVRNNNIEFNELIILNDENIAELIHLLKESVQQNGLHGISGSLSGWVKLQLKDNRKNEKIYDYLKLYKNINEMGIDRMFSDYNYGLTVSTGKDCPLGNSTYIKNSNMYLSNVYEIKISDDSVDIITQYKDEDFMENIIILNENQINEIKNSPFGLLIDRKLMNKQEYNNIITLITKYNKLTKDKLEYYNNVTKIVSDYWTDLLKNPSYNIDENNINDIFLTSLEIMGSEKQKSQITPENLEKFNLVLQQKILKDIIENGRVELKVDYSPCKILKESAISAGIEPNFPYKLWSTIDSDKVVINGQKVLTNTPSEENNQKNKQ